LLQRFPYPKDLITFWLSNPAGEHLYLVGAGMVKMTGSIRGHIQNFLFFAFLICWGVLFKHRKHFSLLIWVLFLYTQLGQYQGRSIFLYYIAIPIYLYLFTMNNNKIKKIFLISSFAIFSIIFLAFVGTLRGELNIYKFIHSPTEQILFTISEVTSPIANALDMYTKGYRGSPMEYLKILGTLPIPRFIWPEKPYFFFNIYITELIRGYKITRGYAIATYTFYGEALYYFGMIGPLLIMFIFGLLARFTEKLICSNKLFLGLYPSFLIMSSITIRSLFVTELIFIIQNIITLIILHLLLPKKEDTNEI